MRYIQNMTQLFSTKTATSNIPHYFGDVVRRLFILNGAIMLLALPFLEGFLPLSTLISTTGIVFLIIFAALTNPMLPWVNKTNVFISAVGLIIFENLAIVSYKIVSFEQTIIYQVLAGIFFFSLYFGVKTFRAMAIGQITPETVLEASVSEETDSNKSNQEILAEMQKDERPGSF